MLRHLSAALLYPLAERAAGREIRVKAALLKQQAAWPWADRRAWARSQLAERLAIAGADVPYYKDLFRSLKFDPEKLARDPAYLQELPYLTKDTIREHGPRLVSGRCAADQWHVRKTGGSTGPSALIYYSQDALDWTAAVNLQCMDWAGKLPQNLELHLSSRFPETFPWKDRLRERIKCLVLNRANVLTDRFDADGLAEIWRQIRRAKPFLVHGHPSTLYALAIHLRNTGVDGCGMFSVFESTGEVLDVRKRQTVEQVFGCRVVDRYGNAEFGVLAYQRPGETDHRLQVFDWMVWTEQRQQETGDVELVFTGLRNDCMPLVRYCTGDLAEVEETPEGLFVRNIKGRVHDVVTIGQHRYPTHYLQDLLDRLDGIDEFQVEQREGASLLRLVVNDPGRREAISRRIDAWWGKDVHLEFTDLAGLERQGRRNKFRYLVEAERKAG